MSGQRRQRSYDHRLRELVRKTGDSNIAIELGVPRSTAAGWVGGDHQDVVTVDVLEMQEVDLQAEVLKLRRHLRAAGTIVGLLMILVQIPGCSLDHRSLLDVNSRAALLRAIECARRLLPLRVVLRVLGISSSRFHAWRRVENDCRPTDRPSCPKRAPNQLTPEEVFTIGDMVTSPEYRHVPTSRLAILAQRLGKVFAAPSTWARLVRDHGWRRPRLRVHPEKPKVGLRTQRPDEAWHVDTTVIRLLDGTKAYVHAVIDNFSRRILAYRVSERFEIANTLAVLMDAVRGSSGGADENESPPMLVVDGGVENFNGLVDADSRHKPLREISYL